MIRHRISNAVLKDYRQQKVHLLPELPDRTKVAVLVTFRLGDLRELEALEKGEQTILSGG